MEFVLQALSGTLIGLDEPYISGTLPINHGGTNNANLTVNSGDLFYGDGSKMAALPLGTTGQVLTSSGGFPIWATPISGGTIATSGLTVVTGTWSPTLIARNAGTVTGQTTYSADYCYIPEMKLCFINLSVAFGGSGFTSSTVIDSNQDCLPVAIASGNRPNNYVGFNEGNTYLNTVEYNRVVALIWDGGAGNGKENSLSFYNPGGSTQYTAGGWSNTSNKINTSAWYQTAS